MALPLPDLRHVLEQAKFGDRQAVATLYQHYAQPIFRYIAYRVPDDAVEDLTAEVFIAMVEALPRYEITEVPFEAWLYRIAAARIADFHRKKSRRPQTSLSDHLVTSDPAPEDQIIYNEEVMALKAAIQQLNDDYQTVLILRFVERRSHEDVAQTMEKSIEAVKSIQHRALTKLTKILGSDAKVRHYLRGQAS